jgi:hypothetical protein
MSLGFVLPEMGSFWCLGGSEKLFGAGFLRGFGLWAGLRSTV